MALVINGQEVDDSVVEQEFAQVKSHYERMGNIQCCERDDEFRAYAKDSIIARVLLSQDAQRRVDTLPEADVESAFQELAQEHGGEAQLCLMYGVPMDGGAVIKAELRDRLRVERLVDQLCASEAEPTEDELRAFHADHQSEYRTPERVRASHILKTIERVEDRDGLYDQLRALRRQAQAGGDFNAMALEHSDKAREAREATERGDNPDGDDGIDLGWFGRGELFDEVELIAFSMNVGEVSPVFATTYGLHLLKVTDRSEPRDLAYADVADQVREHCQEARRARVIQDHVDALKAEATIEEREDSGFDAAPI